MTLSTSRQQFLAYESQAPEEIHYGRKGGVFISSCVCAVLVLAVVVAVAAVGFAGYYFTSYYLPQSSDDFWDENDPFVVEGPPTPGLRLPTHIIPSFYRLKIKADPEKPTFTGDVSITIRANKRVKEIILHSNDLTILDHPRLTEQIYEKVSMYRSKRSPVDEDAKTNNTQTSTNDTNSTVEQETTTVQDMVTESSTPTPPINETTKTTPNTTDATTVEPTTEMPTTTQTQASNISEATTEAPETQTTVVDNEVTHSTVKDIKIVSVVQKSGDRLVITLNEMLKTGVDYTLELSYIGNISTKLTGFYKSTYMTKTQESRTLAVTQFQATSARSAFPCFDEPQFKAMFEISIAHPKNLTALSNMKITSHEDVLDTSDWQWTHFDRSVNMSTYLVAFVISNFQYAETSYISQDNTTKPIRIWVRSEMLHKVGYALEVTPKILKYYEQVFGIPYVLDKLDLVAIPDFINGAMENWGLITFREVALLYDAVEAVPRDKQNVAVVIAHEIAHQWFGNLVTMEWWTDLWLNEGFATYIEQVGVNKIEPSMGMLDQFTCETMSLLRADALKNTSPVSRQVNDASEITQKFDPISYMKAASLIRMLNHTISEKLFLKGLQVYLNDWKYMNAEENNLWESMTTAIRTEPKLQNLSVVSYMNTWTRQAGYPVVNVRRNYDNGDVVFEQRLFSTSPDPYERMLKQVWHIPISYTSIGSQNWTTEPKIWLKDRSLSLTLDVKEKDALYVNVDAIGYYRVNYDTNNWKLLKGVIEKLPPMTRAQLIDDAFNLAKIGQLDYSYALSLSTYVINGEDSLVVWETLLNNFAFLKFTLRSTPGYVYFQDYVKALLKTQLEKINYGKNPPKDFNEAQLIDNLLGWECEVESERCIHWAKEQFDNWSSQADINNNSIPTHLRPLVYNTAVKHGGRREFEFMWNLFVNSTDPNVKNLAISSLIDTQKESLIALLLERSLKDIPKQYVEIVWNFGSRISLTMARSFLIQNWDRIYAGFKDLDSFVLSGMLSGAFGGITTQNELDMFKSFVIKHKNELVPMSQTVQKLMDTARIGINWLAKHSETIDQWFRTYLDGLSQTSNKNATTIVPEQNSTSANITTNTTESSVTPVPQTPLRLSVVNSTLETDNVTKSN